MNGIQVQLQGINTYLQDAISNPINGQTVEGFFYSFEKAIFETLKIAKMIFDDIDDEILPQNVRLGFNKAVSQFKTFSKSKPKFDRLEDADDTYQYDEVGEFMDRRKKSLDLHHEERGDIYKFLSQAEEREKSMNQLLGNIPKYHSGKEKTHHKNLSLFSITQNDKHYLTSEAQTQFTEEGLREMIQLYFSQRAQQAKSRGVQYGYEDEMGIFMEGCITGVKKKIGTEKAVQLDGIEGLQGLENLKNELKSIDQKQIQNEKHKQNHGKKKKNSNVKNESSDKSSLKKTQNQISDSKQSQLIDCLQSNELQNKTQKNKQQKARHANKKSSSQLTMIEGEDDDGEQAQNLIEIHNNNKKKVSGLIKNVTKHSQSSHIPELPKKQKSQASLCSDKQNNNIGKSHDKHKQKNSIKSKKDSIKSIISHRDSKGMLKTDEISKVKSNMNTKLTSFNQSKSKLYHNSQIHQDKMLEQSKFNDAIKTVQTKQTQKSKINSSSKYANDGLSIQKQEFKVNLVQNNIQSKQISHQNALNHHTEANRFSDDKNSSIYYQGLRNSQDSQQVSFHANLVEQSLIQNRKQISTIPNIFDKSKSSFHKQSSVLAASHRQKEYLNFPSIQQKAQNHKSVHQSFGGLASNEKLAQLKAEELRIMKEIDAFTANSKTNDKNLGKISMYIQFIQTMHFRECGGRCHHLQKFYEFLRRKNIIFQEYRKQLILHKKNIQLDQRYF